MVLNRAGGSQEGVDRTPRVSVITIFLNAERFIQEAIDSVFAQTYDLWELLLVDDGSTDGSTALALRLAAQHPDRVRYLRHLDHRNLGMSASRNLGIRSARGEYVAFLDADDVYLPPKLERQVQLLDARPEAAMVYGPTLHWHSWTGRPEDLVSDFHRKMGVAPDTLVQPPDLVRLFLDHEAWPPATCGVLVRRSAVDEISGFEERFEGMFEDQVFFYKLCLMAPAFVEGGTWDLYRQHEESLSQTKHRTGEWSPGRGPNPAREKFLNWLEKYMREQGVDDPALWRSLRRELRPYRHPYLYPLLAMGARARRALKRNPAAASRPSSS